MLRYLLEDYLDMTGVFSAGKETVYFDALTLAKSSLLPMIAPNRDVEEALRIFFRSRKIKLPRKRYPGPGQSRYTHPGKKGGNVKQTGHKPVR